MLLSQTGKKLFLCTAYKELIYLQPDNHEYLENLIAVYFAKKQYEDGKNYLDVLIEKFPDSENIAKFKDFIKSIDDEAAVEVPLEEDLQPDFETSIFEEELENQD